MGEIIYNSASFDAIDLSIACKGNTKNPNKKIRLLKK
jgi:hypothetical protein